MIIVDRKTKKEYEYNSSAFVKFLYNNNFGRMILKLFSNSVFANIGACFMNSRLSKFMMNSKVREYNIDMRNFVDKEYKSYNDFFTRRIKKLNYDNNSNSFISPCDSKLMILPLANETKFEIKGSVYNVNEIINDSIVCEYINGYALIFRLDVNDYHRYCYIDNGTRSDFKYIKGELHTVQPIAYDKVKVFHRNSREWCVLHTENFDDVIMLEVGALLVGKINNDKNKVEFKKGDEKGYFSFGGSTIILFVKEKCVSFDKDILENSKKGKETIVSCGERIGIKK